MAARHLFGYEGERLIAYFWFVGWGHLALGVSIYLGAPNIEIHVPFGFFRIGRRAAPSRVILEVS